MNSDDMFDLKFQAKDYRDSKEFLTNRANLII